MSQPVGLRSPRGRSQRKRGQAMVEFALIAPTFFLLIMGALDFPLMLFSIGSAKFASADAARIEGQVGDSPGRNLCGATCTSLGIGQGVNGTDCDADCQAIVSIHGSPLFTSSLVRVLEIDVIKETVSGGTLSDSKWETKFLPSGQPCAQYNVNYRNGTARTYCITTGLGLTAYSTNTRDVIFGQTDTLKFDIVYEYDWKTGLVSVINPVPPELHASYVVSLEPQGYR
jgi:hypothetical protein